MSECLDENVVAAFVERRLSEAEREAVLLHLDGCGDCVVVTCEAARDATAGDAPSKDDAGFGGPLQRGSTVGRYALLEMIGQGAMGSVYSAHDPQLDRKVALKLVRAERLAGPDARGRLSREARAMAKVSHPSVIHVYDAGEVESGVFIAMELIDGVTLAAWLRERPRTPTEVLDVFFAAGRGLAAAHAAGIVHRDFKPDNVLIDRAGRVTVTDFGLAMAPSGERVDAATSVRPVDQGGLALTRTGAVLGTPSYMSPEQYAGGTVDTRTDQFSFAVALYEGLYSERPFAGETLGELQEAVANGRVREAPPSASQTVKPLLRRALVRGLKPDPTERYASLDAFLAALEDARLDPDRRASRARRTRTLALGLGIVVALASGGVVLARRGDQATREPTAQAAASARPVAVAGLTPGRPGARIAVLVLGIDNPSGNPLLDGTVEAALASALYVSRRIDPYAGLELDTLSRELVDDKDAKARLLKVGAAFAARDDVPVVNVHGSVTPRGEGFVLAIEGRDAASARSLFRLEEPADHASDVVGAAIRLGARSRVALGDAAADAGAPEMTLSSSLEAVHEWDVGHQRGAQGDSYGSLEHLRRAVALDPAFGEGHAELGVALYRLVRFPEAAAEFQLALKDGARLGERKRLSLLGDYYGSVGRYAESIAIHEQLLSKWPGDSTIELRVAATAIDAEEWPLAMELARRAVIDHPRAVVARANLVLVHLGNNTLEEAVREGETMIAELSRTPRFGFADVAMAHALLGQVDDALKTFDKLAATDPELADEGRADLALYQGRLDDAAALLQGQIDQAVARRAPDNARTEYIALARLLLRRGEPKRALASATAAIGGGSVRAQYLVAALLIEAGGSVRAKELTHTWSESVSPEWRMYARLIDGDVLRLRGRAHEAVLAYQEAGRLHDSWIVHERLGRAYLAAGAFADADRELEACIARRGEAAIFFTPSLSFLPSVYLDRARAKEQAGSPDALAAYDELLALSGKPAGSGPEGPIVGSSPDGLRDLLLQEARRRRALLAAKPREAR